MNTTNLLFIIPSAIFPDFAVGIVLWRNLFEDMIEYTGKEVVLTYLTPVRQVSY